MMPTSGIPRSSPVTGSTSGASAATSTASGFSSLGTLSRYTRTKSATCCRMAPSDSGESNVISSSSTSCA